MFKTIKTAEQIQSEALTQAQMSALNTIETFARDVRHKIAGTPDDAEIAGWTQKLMVAKAFLVNTASPADHAVLQAEADQRELGESAQDLAQKIVANGAKFTHLAAMIDGMKSRAKRKVNDATTAQEVAEVLQAMKAEAEATLAAISG
jgi:hypothetical protein